MKHEIDFPENLKNLRKKAGLTRKALANKLNYSEKSIEKWESGDATPPLSVICTLSEIFCVSLDTMIYKDKKEIQYFLGVDGGGTKTAFLLEDRDGKKIAFCELGSSNPNDIGMENCLSVLKNGVMQVTEDIDRKTVAAYFGIAGGGISGDNEFIIKKMLSGLGFAVFGNGSDVDNAIELALGTDDGIVMIAGTGVIGFAQIGNKLVRCGGWGYLIDGGGSGYNVGRDALEAALRHIDGRGEYTLITERLEKHFQKDIRDAIPDIYTGGKRLIASVAPIVFELAQKGDEVALSIIDRNCCAIAQIIRTLQTNFEDMDMPTVICGGLCSNKEILKEYVSKHLNTCEHLKLVTEPMVNGAIKRAQKLAQSLENEQDKYI